MFNIEETLNIEEIETNKGNLKFIQDKMISIEKLFKDKPEIILNEKMLNMFLNGVKLKMNLADGIYRIYGKDKTFIGTGETHNQTLKRDVII